MRALIIAAALACAGCVGTLPPPNTVADQTDVDERGGIAIEALYALAARTGALAFRLGIVTLPTQPEAQRDDFCSLVEAGTFRPADRGAQLMVLECRLRTVRDLGRDAYDAGNAASYEALLTQATRIADQITTLTK